jgi:hypothetical protein
MTNLGPFYRLYGMLILISLIVTKLLHAALNPIPDRDSNGYQKDRDMHLEENSRQDSQGDGLVLFSEPIFPEDFDSY